MFDAHCDYRTGHDEFDPEGKFSYERLNDELRTPENLVALGYCGYQARLGRKMGGAGSDAFIHVISLADIPAKTTEIPRALKIHISLKEELEARLFGWNIVKYILLKYASSAESVGPRRLFKLSQLMIQGDLQAI